MSARFASGHGSSHPHRSGATCAEPLVTPRLVLMHRPAPRSFALAIATGAGTNANGPLWEERPDGMTLSVVARLAPSERLEQRAQIDRLLLLLLEQAVDRAQDAGLRRTRHGLADGGRLKQPGGDGAT